MTSKGEGCTGPKVPDFDSCIDTAAGQDVGIIVETDDPLRVAFQGTNALSRPPVPHP